MFCSIFPDGNSKRPWKAWRPSLTSTSDSLEILSAPHFALSLPQQGYSMEGFQPVLQSYTVLKEGGIALIAAHLPVRHRCSRPITTFSKKKSFECVIVGGLPVPPPLQALSSLENEKRQRNNASPKKGGERGRKKHRPLSGALPAAGRENPEKTGKNVRRPYLVISAAQGAAGSRSRHPCPLPFPRTGPAPPGRGAAERRRRGPRRG